MPQRVILPMHLVDEPEVAMRTEISDDYLRQLADDISQNGLINPISVKKEGERYRIAAGHCRYLAHKLLFRDNIEANDYSGDSVDIEAIKVSENLCRHDVTDAEMALYLSQIQEKYHYDMETLMRLTRRSESWINTRLKLFAGDERVFAALSTGKINLGQAVVLNRFPEQFRLSYLQTVIESTPPARVVENWLAELKKQGLENLVIPESESAAPQTVSLPGVVEEACTICGGAHMPWTMKFPRVHEHCMEMIKKAILESGGVGQ